MTDNNPKQGELFSIPIAVAAVRYSLQHWDEFVKEGNVPSFIPVPEARKQFGDVLVFFRTLNHEILMELVKLIQKEYS